MPRKRGGLRCLATLKWYYYINVLVILLLYGGYDGKSLYMFALKGNSMAVRCTQDDIAEFLGKFDIKVEGVCNLIPRIH